MKHVYLLVGASVLTLATTAFGNTLNKRVLDGSEVKPPFKYPFVTALKVDTEVNGELFNCGGTLLNEKWVLTAGQCSFTVSAGNGDPRDWKRTHVETGRHDLRKSVKQEKKGRYGVNEQITHPDFFDELGPLFNDLGLWEIKGKAVGAAKVELRRRTYIPRGTIAKLAGWGRRDEDDEETSSVLRVADIEILSNRLCKKLLPETDEFGPDFDGDIQICGKGFKGKTGISSGDAGSPLFIIGEKNVPEIVGIASRTRLVKGETISIFTRVSAFAPFIKKTISGK